MDNMQALGPRQLLQTHREALLLLARRYGASNVRIFGSVARGQATASSDLDLLVDLTPERSLLDRVALIQELGDLLGLQVDVVTPNSLHPSIRADVLKQAQPL